MTDQEFEVTSDMTISIDRGNLDSLVDRIMNELPKFTDYNDCLKLIIDEFNLTENDAALALDRVPGGIVRALTGNRMNEPNEKLDPMAHMSFQKAWLEFPEKGFFFKKKVPGGRWMTWFEDLRKMTNG